VKNLRELRSLSIVAFKRRNINRGTNPDQFAFRADFLDLNDPLRDLMADQEAGVKALVDDLPNRKVPSEFDHMLPGERKVRVRLTEGPPVMLRQLSSLTTVLHGRDSNLPAKDLCEMTLVGEASRNARIADAKLRIAEISLRTFDSALQDILIGSQACTRLE
jgi:hypothetical protein